MRLEAALVGDLPAEMKSELEHGARAASLGTSRTLDSLKADLRAQIMAAFGSQRLANAWRTKMFPALPKTSLGAAGVAYSNAPHIIEAFSAATVIHSANGFWLAIPSPDCPKGSGGRRLTPSTFPEDRFGKLHFVYRQGKSSLLVVDQVRRHTGSRAGFVKASAASISKGTAESIVMFFLVPFVSLKQMIDPQAAYDRALDELVNNVIEEWNRGDAA